MDRTGSWRAVGEPSMRPGEVVSVELLSRGHRYGERNESATDESDRPVILAALLLWFAPDDRLVAGSGLGGQREARGPAHAGDVFAGDRARTPYQSASSCASGVSVSAARCRGDGAECGVVRRHNVRAVDAGIHVSVRSDGLGQPIRIGMGTVEHLGGRLLRGVVESGTEALRETGHIEYRSRIAVHE